MEKQYVRILVTEKSRTMLKKLSTLEKRKMIDQLEVLLTQALKTKIEELRSHNG